MDRALYIAMTGATQALKAQTVNSHNLANASTVGFKAELAAQAAVEVEGGGLPTRVNVQLNGSGWDARAGAIQQTGRDLDIALGNDRWLAVQAPDGSEAYTRAGDLQIDVNGQLRTSAGHAVMGDGGPVHLQQGRLAPGCQDGVVLLPKLRHGAVGDQFPKHARHGLRPCIEGVQACQERDAVPLDGEDVDRKSVV